MPALKVAEVKETTVPSDWLSFGTGRHHGSDLEGSLQHVLARPEATSKQCSIKRLADVR